MPKNKSFSRSMAACLIAAFLLGTVAAVPADAQVRLWRWDVSLDALQEVPTNPSPGTGTAVVWLDEIAMTLDVSGTFQGLASPTVENPAGRGHLHGPAPPGVNAGVLVGLTVDGEVTSGMFTSNGPVGVSQTVMDHMLAGQTYLNIHTDLYPAGEIRGNLLNPIFIPEPSSSVSLLVALAGGLLWRRRRRSG